MTKTQEQLMTVTYALLAVCLSFPFPHQAAAGPSLLPPASTLQDHDCIFITRTWQHMEGS